MTAYVTVDSLLSQIILESINLKLSLVPSMQILITQPHRNSYNTINMGDEKNCQDIRNIGKVTSPKITK